MENNLEEEKLRERSPRSTKPSFRNYKCYAIGIAYCGEEYFGSQIQPGDLITVEGEVQRSLVSAGLIEASLLNEHKADFFWSRAARTDRGVHACMNVISCRLDETKIKHSSSGVPISTKNPLCISQGDFIEHLNKFLPESIRTIFINRVTMRFDARLNCERRKYEYYLPNMIDGIKIDIEKLKTEMNKYLGTKKFHNFTKSVKYSEKQAVRHIAGIEVNHVYDDKFICITLTGQSFLLNQIRKMIGLALEVVLGLAPSDAIEQAFTNKTVHVHMVPGEGLLLDSMNFKGYDLHRCGDYTVTTPFSWIIGEEGEADMLPIVEAQVLAFKNKLIPEKILAKLASLLEFWNRKIVLAHSWESRHSESAKPQEYEDLVE